MESQTRRNSKYFSFNFTVDKNEISFEKIPKEMFLFLAEIVSAIKSTQSIKEAEFELNKKFSSSNISIKISDNSKPGDEIQSCCLEFFRDFGENMLKREKSLYEAVDFSFQESKEEYSHVSLFGYSPNFIKQLEFALIYLRNGMSISRIQKELSTENFHIRISELEFGDNVLNYRFELFSKI